MQATPVCLGESDKMMIAAVDCMHKGDIIAHAV